MKMYKLEVYVVDHENLGIDSIKTALHNNKYYFFDVKHSSEADIGEWWDGHVFNHVNTPLTVFRHAFSKKTEEYLGDLMERLKIRAIIRRKIPTRKSVQEGKPDRLADLLDEAASVIEHIEDYQ